MDFIDNINLVFSFCRWIAHRFAEITDLIHAAVRGAVDLEYVDAPVLGDLYAEFTGIVGIEILWLEAIDRFGKNTRGCCFSYAPRAAENIGM